MQMLVIQCGRGEVDIQSADAGAGRHHVFNAARRFLPTPRCASTGRGALRCSRRRALSIAYSRRRHLSERRMPLRSAKSRLRRQRRPAAVTHRRRRQGRGPVAGCSRGRDPTGRPTGESGDRPARRSGRTRSWEPAARGWPAAVPPPVRTARRERSHFLPRSRS